MGRISVPSFIPHDPAWSSTQFHHNFITNSFSAFGTHPALQIFITILKPSFSVALLFIEHTSLPPATLSQMKCRPNKHEYGVTTIRDATQEAFWTIRPCGGTRWRGGFGWTTPIFASQFWYRVAWWKVPFSSRVMHFLILFMSLWGYSERLFTSRIICFGTSLVIWFSFISLFNAS